MNLRWIAKINVKKDIFIFICVFTILYSKNFMRINIVHTHICISATAKPFTLWQTKSIQIRFRIRIMRSHEP